MEQEKYCPKCGYKNDFDSLFCVACGNKLPSIQNNIKQENIEKKQATVPIENTSKRNCICPVCGKDDKIQKISSIIAKYDSEFKSNSTASGTLNTTTSSIGFSSPFLSKGQIIYNTSQSNTEGVMAYNSSESGVQTTQLVKILKQLPSGQYTKPPSPMTPKRAVSEAIRQDLLSLPTDVHDQKYFKNIYNNRYFVTGLISVGIIYTFISLIIGGMEFLLGLSFMIFVVIFLISIVIVLLVFISSLFSERKRAIHRYYDEQKIKERRKDEYDKIYKEQEEIYKNHKDNLLKLEKKSVKREKYIKNKFEKTYYCYRDDVIFEPGCNHFGMLSDLKSIKNYYLKGYQDD